MLFSSLRRAAVLAAAAISIPFAQAADGDGQSTFVSDNKDLAFGITVPSNSQDEWYITMRIASSRSWGAVGVGSHQMAGALFLIVYKSDNGSSVTFSPRLSYNNYEPEYYDDLNHLVMGENITVTNDYYQVSARINDRNWPQKETNGGWFSSGNSKAIYGLGPKSPLYSDSLNADLRFHNEYGSLTIDLDRSKGNADAPSIPQNPTTEGVTVVSTTKNRVDNRSTLHATFMVLGVLVLLPLGVVFLRVIKWARWHGVTQLCAVLVILAAAGLGVADSFYYARSWHFNSPHQIIGLVTIGLFIGQLVLGIFHHMERKDLMSPTKWSNIHLWMGRVALLLGWINCFIGFNFAMNRKTGFVIALVIIAILFAALFFMFYLSRQRRKAAVYGANQAQTFGQEPWRRAAEANAARGEYDPGQNDFNSDVNLQSASPWQSGEQATNRTYVDEPEVGGVATPKPTPKVQQQE